MEKFRPLNKSHLDLSNKRHRPTERACIHHGPTSLRHRSANVKPTQSRDESIKSLKSRNQSSNQESSKKQHSKNKGNSTNLRSSNSLFQLSSSRSKHQIPGIEHFHNQASIQLHHQIILTLTSSNIYSN